MSWDCPEHRKTFYPLPQRAHKWPATAPHFTLRFQSEHRFCRASNLNHFQLLSPDHDVHLKSVGFAGALSATLAASADFRDRPPPCAGTLSIQRLSRSATIPTISQCDRCISTSLSQLLVNSLRARSLLQDRLYQSRFRLRPTLTRPCKHGCFARGQACTGLEVYSCSPSTCLVDETTTRSLNDGAPAKPQS